MAALPYNDVPTPSQRLSDSQPQIQTNFASLKTFIEINHVELADGTNPGKHKFLQMPQQGSAPATSTTEMALYTKDVSGKPQMFIRRDTNGAEINFTSVTLGSSGTLTLPNGLIMKWGQTTGAALPGNSWSLITFPVAFPTNCYSIQVSPKVVTVQPSTAQTTTLIILDVNYNKTNFHVFNRRTDQGIPGIAADFTYFAVGD